jgi:hypothetical protein
MSGGHFDYKQYQIEYVADEIEQMIVTNDSEERNEWGEPVRWGYTEETISRFKLAVLYLRLAKIYTQRIDWLVSGDDGEDSFHSRLEQELNDLTKQMNDNKNSAALS